MSLLIVPSKSHVTAVYTQEKGKMEKSQNLSSAHQLNSQVLCSQIGFLCSNCTCLINKQSNTEKFSRTRGFQLRHNMESPLDTMFLVVLAYSDKAKRDKGLFWITLQIAVQYDKEITVTGF